MKAAIWRRDQPVSIEEVELDEPGPREVRIRTAAAGICHSDLSVLEERIEGYPPIDAGGPMVLGHESSGVVEAVGGLVTYVEPGDHVITFPVVFCGACRFCVTGRPYLCAGSGVVRGADERPRITQAGSRVYQFSELGSFAEQLLVHEHSVVKIDPRMPLDKAALLGCGVTTGLGAVFNTAELPPGSTVAIIGCGGVGLSAVQAARIAGARRVICVDRLQSRIDAALALGGTDGVNASETDAVAAVLELSDGGVEYAFEVVGRKDTAEEAFAMLERGGTLTLVGLQTNEPLEIPGFALMMMQRRIQGCMMGSSRFRVDLPIYIDLYLQGRLKLDEMVTDHLSLDQLTEGFDRLNRGEGLRSVVAFA